MILESIELKHVGLFRRGASIGPLKPGINVLAAPNERGKSTFMRAAARALFDKHTCGDPEIRSLQPAGTTLAPTISVVFETGGQRYHVQKRFLNKPESEISRWRNGAWQLWEKEDKADEIVQGLLQSSVPGRNSTKAAHWGLLGYLWARQGEPCDWPAWEGQTGEQIQSRLAKVEIDPVIEKLKEELWDEYAQLFTANGKARKNGELERLEKEWESNVEKLQAIQQKMAELNDLERRFAELAPEVTTLDAEVKDREREASELKEQVQKVEALQNELRARENELQSTNEKLETIVGDKNKLASHEENLVVAKEALEYAAQASQRAASEEVLAKVTVGNCQQQYDSITRELGEQNAQAQRIADLIKLKRMDREAVSAKQRFEKASGQASAMRELQTQLNKLPNLTVQKLKKLQELQEQIRMAATKLEAIGLTIEVTPQKAAKIDFLHDAKTDGILLKEKQLEVLHAAQAAELRIDGWGVLRIRCGAAELKDLQTQLTTDRKALQDELVSLGVSSVSEAEEKLALRKELQRSCEEAEKTLRESLGKAATVEELQREAAQFSAQMEALRKAINPTEAEAAESEAELDANFAKISVIVKEMNAAQKAAAGSLREQRKAVEKQAETLRNAEKAHASAAERVKSLRQQISALNERYSQGIEAAKKEAQTNWLKAEARRDDVKSKLPMDFEKLPERNKRAAAASQESRSSLERKRTQLNQIEGSLQTVGAEGLYSQESALLERQEALRPKLEDIRVMGWAARLAHDLIDNRKQAATRAVLGPLENRLSDAFAELSQNSDRRVFLDEQLAVKGIGSSADALIGFENLSQGAKEQLLLCLRMAVAMEVAPTGHKLVILDDVLVNTDAQRQQRVLDMLHAAAEKLQIIILTCHPDRYRGVGSIVEIQEDQN